jgi:hypothetical protein
MSRGQIKLRIPSCVNYHSSITSVAEAAPVNLTYASQHTYSLSTIIASEKVMALPVIEQIGPNCPVAVDNFDASGTFYRDIFSLFILPIA